MESDFVLDDIQPDDQSTQKKDKQTSEQQDIKDIKERLFNALKEIAHLEKAIEDKNTQIGISVKEKDRLIHALQKAFEERKGLYDRLADLDIVRNMEILELKQGIESLRDEENKLLKENEELRKNIFMLEKTIDNMRTLPEGKELKLKKQDMDSEDFSKKSAINVDSSMVYSDIEQGIEASKENNALLGHAREEKTETEMQQRTKIEELTRMLSELNQIADEKTAENTSLEHEISSLKAMLDKNKEDDGATDALKKQLSEALGNIRLLEEKKSEHIRELSEKNKIISEYQETLASLTVERSSQSEKIGDTTEKALSPVEEIEQSMGFVKKEEKPSAKMIYIESGRFRGMAIILTGIIFLILIGILFFDKLNLILNKILQSFP